MLKFIGLLVLLVAIVAAIGYFRGWFDVSKTEGVADTKIELRIDKEKVREDVEAVKDKAQNLGRTEAQDNP